MEKSSINNRIKITKLTFMKDIGKMVKNMDKGQCGFPTVLKLTHHGKMIKFLRKTLIIVLYFQM